MFAWRCADALGTDASELTAGRPVRRAEVPVAGRGGTPVVRSELQELMWSVVGLERSLEGLRHAASVLAGWVAVGDTAESGADRNLLDLARIVVEAAIRREESRGAHDRTDFPLVSDEFAYSLEVFQPVHERVSA